MRTLVATPDPDNGPVFELDDEETVYRLVFPDHPTLSVGMREVSVGDYLDLLGHAEQVQGATTADAPRVAGAFRALTDRFAECVADWNITRTGQPVTPTGDTVRALGLRLSMRMVMAWLDAQGGVEAPLGPVSPGGVTGTLSVIGELPKTVSLPS